MAWEYRGNNGPYYTRSKKIGGRVVRQYVGGGTVGQLASATDARLRAEREAQAADWQAEKARLEALEADVAALWEGADIMARATLLASGYHQHDRGEWRQSRALRYCAKG